MDRVEDYASAQLELSNGTAVRLACSWWLSAGQDCVIEAAFHGTAGGVVLRNVNGSFHVARDGAEMRRHLRALLEEPGLAGALADEGLATIRARHTCAHRVDELADVLRQLG